MTIGLGPFWDWEKIYFLECFETWEKISGFESSRDERGSGKGGWGIVLFVAAPVWFSWLFGGDASDLTWGWPV